jgi:hypothetical protein
MMGNSLYNQSVILSDGREGISIFSIMAAYPTLFFEPSQAKGEPIILTLVNRAVGKSSTVLIDVILPDIFRDEVYIDVQFFLNSIKPLML